MFLRRLRHRWHRRIPLPTWYDPRYRLPIIAVESRLGLEPRRADFVLGYLLDTGMLSERDQRAPERVSYLDLERVHSPRLLESLHQPEGLAHVFSVDPIDVHVDEALLTVRLACGATLAAARDALATRRATLNLLGGFHHAEPDRASALCAVNDIAVAIAVLRSEGVAGRVVVLDLDAHPPDGTAACFRGDDSVWIGSLSGADWGKLEGVDETVLARGSGDEVYLAALSQLLARMPRADLAFVIAGGDVLAGDRMGALGMSLEGARRRDLAVSEALAGTGSVWLPGGGYHPDAWKVLAGTAMALIARSRQPIAEDYQPTRTRFERIASTLAPPELGAGGELSMEEVLADLGVRPQQPRLLGYYTAAGVELALERYGILAHLRRIGYERFEVELASEASRDRARLSAWYQGKRHVLIECVLEKRELGGEPVLYVHWLSLEDAARHFDPRTRRLPGQEHPGLGLSTEMGELFARIAERLGLHGVAFTPSWYHMAFLARRQGCFVDAARQGRFEALMRALEGMPLGEATVAVAEERVLMNGATYRWEPDDMVSWLDGRMHDPGAVRAERDRVHFQVALPRLDSAAALQH
jgi:acetoin utilization deacetylase AcuC-like enzyme